MGFFLKVQTVQRSFILPACKIKFITLEIFSKSVQTFFWNFPERTCMWGRQASGNVVCEPFYGTFSVPGERLVIDWCGCISCRGVSLTDSAVIFQSEQLAWSNRNTEAHSFSTVYCSLSPDLCLSPSLRSPVSITLSVLSHSAACSSHREHTHTFQCGLWSRSCTMRTRCVRNKTPTCMSHVLRVPSLSAVTKYFPQGLTVMTIDPRSLLWAANCPTGRLRKVFQSLTTPEPPQDTRSAPPGGFSDTTLLRLCVSACLRQRFSLNKSADINARAQRLLVSACFVFLTTQQKQRYGSGSGPHVKCFWEWL